MSLNDSDVAIASVPHSDGSRAILDRDIPWGGLALSGMGLIAVSLVVFVMVTEGAERASPQAPALVDALPPKRISVPDLPPAAPSGVRAEDATASIGRTIRPPAAPGHLVAPPPADR